LDPDIARSAPQANRAGLAEFSAHLAEPVVEPRLELAVKTRLESLAETSFDLPVETRFPVQTRFELLVGTRKRPTSRLQATL